MSKLAVGVEPDSSWMMLDPSYRKAVLDPPMDFDMRRPKASYWKLAEVVPLREPNCPLAFHV
jgi:hypothetical protein